jgi:hypothetical protein
MQLSNRVEVALALASLNDSDDLHHPRMRRWWGPSLPDRDCKLDARLVDTRRQNQLSHGGEQTTGMDERTEPPRTERREPGLRSIDFLFAHYLLMCGGEKYHEGFGAAGFMNWGCVLFPRFWLGMR